MSSFGGVLDISFDLNSHDEFCDMEHILQGRHSADSFSSHVDDVGLGLECSYDAECDKLSMSKHFLDVFSSLVINLLLECEEVAVCVQSNLVEIDIANEVKSDFTGPSHMDAQGELQFHDTCDSVNEVEYEAFVFPIDDVHESVDDGHFQFDIRGSEHANSYFHSEKEEEDASSFYMHYENGDSYFVLPTKVIESVDVLGEANENESFSLPQDVENEN